ncbi:MAG: TIGR00730 family Rossman fold protein [Gammaproteobacteria bacterium]|nr:TIGR00730 family Rossman fold protein [Gammaproteobacteria bacterium]|tara:strand:+ start:2368 stop:2949 length:582 start_codon:yes stop_codon:yes gene_type:complete
MKSVCIFAGANKGTNKAYSEIAHSLGRELVKNNLSMVYGGGSVGLMNEIANEVLKNEGEVTGVITKRLKDVEVAHKSLTKLFIVDSMHERKAKMAEISDAIISLPGGVGTWEEFFEALAWNQLGIHSKPIILLNVEGYYDELYAFTKKACHEGFLPQSTLDDFYLTNSVKDSLSIINTFTPKDKSLWYKRLKE